MAGLGLVIARELVRGRGGQPLLARTSANGTSSEPSFRPPLSITAAPQNYHSSRDSASATVTGECTRSA
jgi:hypothetical protein